MKTMRYAQILAELRSTQAAVVLEVGTWNGGRAVEMLKTCAATRGRGFYYGFDMFEGMDAEKSAEEFNVKAPASFAKVDAHLRSYTAQKEWLGYKLYKGDTRVTLPAFVASGPEPVDLAWVDGGHSVVTIASDFANVRQVVRRGHPILLDDYYTGMPRNFTTQFGCNVLVASLITEGARVHIYPQKDPVKGGGFVQMVRVVL